MTRLASLAAGLAVLTLAACAGTPAPSTTSEAAPSEAASEAPPAPTLTVTSADFGDGEPMPASSLADAFGGQCAGDNVSPELSWSGAPAGTESFALTIIDVDAGQFVHAVTVDVPADVTSFAAGTWDTHGTIGAHSARGVGYFGPCPPSGVHEYVFTVHALDTTLELAEGFPYAELLVALGDHELAAGSITGTVAAD